MKQKAMRDMSAFTRIELIVVVVIFGVLAAMLLQSKTRARGGSNRITCLGNLREIGTAYRLWAVEHGDLMPFQQTASNGGWKDLLTNADQGRNCWTNYAMMSNYHGRQPKHLVCPKDGRWAAEEFATKDNTHLSYFVGVSANDTHLQSILGGDRNLGPGTVPDSEYGFSPKSGKGNDVAVPISGPVSWSLKMHSGVGNILLGDGSVQPTTSVSFRRDWLSHAEPTTNWPAGHVPASPSIRLVFP
jgi:prepilin-type processing-associated H-X9-DG protein